MKYKYLNGLRTYAPTSSDELIQFAMEKKKILVAVNAEKIIHSNPAFADIVNDNIGYPDGAGAIFALRRKGLHAIKIPGVELWLDIIRLYHSSKSFYLIGAKENIIRKTVEHLRNQYPSIQILNYRNGYIQSKEERELLKKDIIEKKPDILFIAMGSPLQEDLMCELQQVHTAVYQGLGGSFDVFTGNVLRAPRWWINNNLEWAYRLIKQPSRITRQIHLFRFVWLLWRNKI